MSGGPSAPPELDFTSLQDSGAPAWAVALVIWSGSIILFAVAIWRAACIILRVGGDDDDQTPRDHSE